MLGTSRDHDTVSAVDNTVVMKGKFYNSDLFAFSSSIGSLLLKTVKTIVLCTMLPSVVVIIIVSPDFEDLEG